MTNLASSNEGAKVILASSNDDNYPPEAIIDGNPISYWLTTGMFPQQFIISFKCLVAMDSILLRCTKVQRLRIERSENTKPVNFQAVTEKDTETKDDEIQLVKHEFPKTTATHIKIIILSGFDNFISIHSIIVTGSPVK